MNPNNIVAYDYFGSLYINMTNRCDCRCVFCIRDQEGSGLGGLWLDGEPTRQEVLDSILNMDPTAYPEIVFCGYGEPTYRIDEIFALVDELMKNGKIAFLKEYTARKKKEVTHRGEEPENA